MRRNVASLLTLCGRAAFVFFVLALVLLRSFGQSNDVDQKGFPVDGVFHQGDVDSVNLQNGNLHISIPLASMKQRGGSTVSWQLVYDTQGWNKVWVPSVCTTPKCAISGVYTVEAGYNSGWRFTQSPSWDIGFTATNVTCPYANQPYTQYTNWSVVDSQGTSHPLSLRQEVGATCFGQTLTGPTLDGSGYTYDIPSQTIRGKNGTILFSPTLPVTDANGNTITTDAAAGSGTDTLGRAPISTSTGPTTTYTSPTGKTTTGPQYTRYTVINSSGNAEVYEVDYQAIDAVADA